MKNTFNLLALACLMAGGAHAGLVTITVDTQTLVGHAAAPFYIDLQFTDGSGTGDGNNSVFVNAFDFGVGGSVGALFETASGDVAGDLSTGVMLTDTQFFNQFGQSFNPGDKLTFQVHFTGNVDAGTPDGFTFSILDSSLTPIPTLEPLLQDFVFSMDFDGRATTIQAYGGDTSRSPSAGGDGLAFSTRYANELSSDAPEPATVWQFGAGLLVAAASARKRLAR